MTSFDDGITWRLELIDAFHSTAERFERDIADVTRVVDKASKGLADFSSKSRSLSTNVDKVTLSSRKLADESRAIADSAKKGERSLTEQERAVKKLATRMRGLVVSEKEVVEARRRGIPLQRQVIKGMSVETEARIRHETQLRKEAVARRQARLAQKASSSESGRAAAALEVEVAAAKRAAAAQRELAIQKRLASGGLDPRGAVAVDPRVAEAQAAQKRFNDELSRLRVQERVKGLRAASVEYRNLTGATDAASSALNRNAAAAKKSEGTVNRVAFTFRRLFGILAAFAVAREGLRAFRTLVTDAIQFNSRLEQANLGVASLITATGRLVDITGRTATGAEALGLAQAEARRQTALLRLDAQKTVATFDDLVQTFQVGLAPGLAAGGSLDEVRKFAVSISQAAAAIGVQQNQLAEEIRSILAGTITLRTTRIAAALGITNEDIRLAKEGGVLFDFLTQRFEAFKAAGIEAEQTFEGVFTNLRDALLQVLGGAGLGFFNELKSVLEGIRTGVLLVRDELGNLVPNPRAVVFFKEIFDGLEAAAQQAKLFVQNLTLSETVGVARALGVAISAIATGLRLALTGITQGITDSVNVLQSVGRFLSNAFNLDSSGLEAAVVAITRILTVIVSLRLVLLPVIALVASLASGFTKLFAILVGLPATIARFATLLHAAFLTASALTVKLLLIVGVVVAIAVGAKQLLDNMTGVELKFESVVKIIRVGLVSAFRFAVATGEVAFTRFTQRISILWNGVIGFFRSSLQSLAVGALRLAGLLSDAAAAQADALAASQKKSDDQLAASQTKGQLAILRANDAFKKSLDDISSGATVDIDTIIADNDSAKSFGDLLKDGVEGALDVFSEAIPSLDLDFDSGIQDAKDLQQSLDSIPATVGRSLQGLREQGVELRKIKEEALGAQEALAFTTQTVGADRGIAAAAREFFQASQQARAETGKLQASLGSTTNQLVQVQVQMAAAQRKVSELTKEERDALENVAFQQRARVAALGEAEAAATRLQVIELAIQKARAEGNSEQLRALQQQAAAAEENQARNLKFAEANKLNIAEIQSPLDSDSLEKIQPLLIRILQLEGNEKTLKQETLAINESLLAVERSRVGAAADRVAAQNAEQAFQLGQDSRVTGAELAGEQAILLARREGVQLQVQIAEAQKDVAVQAAIIENLEESRVRSLEAIDAAIANEVVGSKEANTLLKSRELSLGRSRNLLVEARQSLQGMNQDLQELQQLEGSFGEGIASAARFLRSELPTAFQAGADFAISAVKGFAETSAQAIVDVFDPSNEATLQERFGRLAQSLAKQLLTQLLTQILVAVLPLNAVGAGLQTAGVALTAAAAALAPVAKSLITAALLLSSSVLGAAQGGLVGAARGGSVTARTAHSAAKGYAAGGGPKSARPKGLHPTDTVPAWLAVGEYVLRAASVRKYGARFMELLNRGLIPPDAVRSIAQGSPGVAVRKVHRVGFATGGPVGSNVSDDATFEESGGSAAILTLDEATSALIARQSVSGLLRAMNDEPARFRTALQVGRGGGA